MNYIKDTLDYLAKLFQWWILIQPWERGVRTRFGRRVKLLTPGTQFRIPFFDIIYIQTIRLRVVSMAPQTVSTKDGKTVTISCATGYAIGDIMKLYNTLYQPEVTICNMAQGLIAEFIFSRDLIDCGPDKIEQYVSAKLKEGDYGIRFEYAKVVGYAVVRTYRLIQDSAWVSDTMNMTERH